MMKEKSVDTVQKTAQKVDGWRQEMYKGKYCIYWERGRKSLLDELQAKTK